MWIKKKNPLYCSIKTISFFLPSKDIIYYTYTFSLLAFVFWLKNYQINSHSGDRSNTDVHLRRVTQNVLRLSRLTVIKTDNVL